MNWISVKDRHPSRDGLHLVYCGRDDRNLPIYFLATWDVTNGVWRLEDEGLIATVERWTVILDPEGDAA